MSLASDLPTFRNQFLAALPAVELERIVPSLQRVSLVLHQVLHEPGNRIEDVYFVEHGLVSMTCSTGDQRQVEVGLIGCDGLIGGTLLLNPEAMSVHRALVQAPGVAWRMRADVMLSLVEACPELRRQGLRFEQFMMIQAAQTAACNARHETPQRLARWLLMVQDRLESDDLPMTQEFLSFFLGVRRAGVSVVSSALSARGAVRQSRGRITIKDRALLIDEACSCYQIVTQQWGALTNARPHYALKAEALPDDMSSALSAGPAED